MGGSVEVTVEEDAEAGNSPGTIAGLLEDVELDVLCFFMEDRAGGGGRTRGDVARRGVFS